jgi:hypothetical protein
MKRVQLITELRERYLISSEFSDAQVIDLTKGSLGRASIELEFALSNLRKAVKASLPEWLKSMLFGKAVSGSFLPRFRIRFSGRNRSR